MRPSSSTIAFLRAVSNLNFKIEYFVSFVVCARAHSLVIVFIVNYAKSPPRVARHLPPKQMYYERSHFSRRKKMKTTQRWKSIFAVSSGCAKTAENLIFRLFLSNQLNDVAGLATIENIRWHSIRTEPKTYSTADSLWLCSWRWWWCDNVRFRMKWEGGRDTR